MKWLLLLCGLLAGCVHVLHDPLSAARVKQKAIEEMPLPDDWVSQTTLVLGVGLLDDLLESATVNALKKGMKTSQYRILGMDVTMEPSMTLETFEVRGSDACESCVQAELALRGTQRIIMTNSTGKMDKSINWSASIVAVFQVAVTEKKGKKRITAALSGSDDWKVAMELGGLPKKYNRIFGDSLTKAAQKLVAKPKMPLIPIVRLGRDVPVPFAGIRIKRVDEMLAVEFAFQAKGMGKVGALPTVGKEWAVVVPSQTLLGLMQVSALRKPPDTKPMVPAMESLSINDNRFELGIAAWSRKKKPKARRFMVYGTIEVGEDDQLHIEADRAEVVGGKDSVVDLATLLFKKKMLSEITEKLQATIPTEIRKDTGKVEVVVDVIEVSAQQEELFVKGNFEMKL